MTKGHEGMGPSSHACPCPKLAQCDVLTSLTSTFVSKGTGLQGPLPMAESGFWTRFELARPPRLVSFVGRSPSLEIVDSWFLDRYNEIMRLLVRGNVLLDDCLRDFFQDRLRLSAHSSIKKIPLSSDQLVVSTGQGTARHATRCARNEQ